MDSFSFTLTKAQKIMVITIHETMQLKILFP